MLRRFSAANASWPTTANLPDELRVSPPRCRRARAAEVGGDRDAAISSLLAEKQPSGRTSRPEEIGALALWLAHPMAHNVTGAAVPVDGGWTAQSRGAVNVCFWDLADIGLCAAHVCF